MDGSPIGTYHVSMLTSYNGPTDVTPIRPFGRRSVHINEKADDIDESMSNKISDHEDFDNQNHTASPTCTRGQRVIKRPIRYR